MNPEYKHYFCQACSELQKKTIESNPSVSSNLEVTWEPIADGRFECGDWTKDGMKFQGHGCSKPATVQLLSRGGTPIRYVRPE
jgi:hypothetical protein